MCWEAMPTNERWGIHISNNDLSMMALDCILKMDRSGLKHGNEHHPSTSEEWDEDNLELGIEWCIFKKYLYVVVPIGLYLWFSYKDLSITLRCK